MLYLNRGRCDPRRWALNIIGCAFDGTMMMSNEIVTNGRCDHFLFIMFREKYDSADEGVGKLVVKASEDGGEWCVVEKRNGVKYQTADELCMDVCQETELEGKL